MTQLRFKGTSVSPSSSASISVPFDVIFGATTAMHDVRRRIELVAATDVPVLLQGESGTGKDLCAQLIHRLSSRTKGELVKVNCPAIPNSLLEAELFGYERGAFTGASSGKRGRVEQAHRGTLVLDEVGSLDMAAQSKMLQILQDGTFTRVGGHDTQTISTRIISIANRDLSQQVEEGAFRLDLLYRINAVTISLPPLRQRQSDIPALVAYFVKKHSEALQIPPRKVSREIIQLMQTYHWPGNIRQLDNLVRSYVLIGDDDLLVSELSHPGRRDQVMAEVDVTKPLSLKEITKKATQDLERQIILKVLQANSWNRSRTAKWLKMSYRSLLYKLSEAGIHGYQSPDRWEVNPEHPDHMPKDLDAGDSGTELLAMESAPRT
jgi:two-component system response regulator AtoC